MDARIDQAKYALGCRTMENFFPLIYGGAKRRPGTQYIDEQRVSMVGDVPAPAMIIGFEHSVDDTYMLLFENQRITMYEGGTAPVRVVRATTVVTAITGASPANTPNFNGKHSVLSVSTDAFTFASTASTEAVLTATASWGGITTPYLTADLRQLDIKQSADVMFITASGYEPRRLSRTGDTNWTIETTNYDDGPFRNINTNSAITIEVISVTSLVAGETVSLESDGDVFNSLMVPINIPASETKTDAYTSGALFSFKYNIGEGNIGQSLNVSGLVNTSSLTVLKGAGWSFTTNGTWGSGANPATLVLERSYDDGSTYETLVTVTSAGNKNVTTSGTEDVDDALYRARVIEVGASSTVAIDISVDDTTAIGVVEIQTVADTENATGIIRTSLGTSSDTTLTTSQWSEGSWSGYRGWPIAADISPEGRLMFGGSVSKPLTVWGTKAGDFTSMKLGTVDDDAISFTLIGSGQQNRIQWMVPKTSMMIGTVGGEHLLGASAEDEALTPTNVQAKLQATYGSEKIAALIVNNAILFSQRGGKKIRELVYNFQDNVHKADDLTVFSNHITGPGIVDMAFQRTPDPMLWCVRSDGVLAVMTYEREMDVYSWCRFVTDGEFESVGIMYGGTREEDEVWVTVLRYIEGSPRR